MLGEMKINSEFYSQVLNAYSNTWLFNGEFICHNSELFKSAWGSTEGKHIIKSHFEKFLSCCYPNEYKNKTIECGQDTLCNIRFYATGQVYIRIEFLEWASNPENLGEK